MLCYGEGARLIETVPYDFPLQVVFYRSSEDPMSQRFGHPRALGIPIPKSPAFWAPPSHITAAF